MSDHLRHPIQPLYEDDDGILRFKHNTIVQYLLDHGGIDLNALARVPFSPEDREQFHQLIGYSLDGFADLSITRTGTVAAAYAAWLTRGADDFETRIPAPGENKR